MLVKQRKAPSFKPGLARLTFVYRAVRKIDHVLDRGQILFSVNNSLIPFFAEISFSSVNDLFHQDLHSDDRLLYKNAYRYRIHDIRRMDTVREVFHRISPAVSDKACHNAEKVAGLDAVLPADAVVTPYDIILRAYRDYAVKYVFVRGTAVKHHVARFAPPSGLFRYGEKVSPLPKQWHDAHTDVCVG